jgi:hypothetical protein
LLVVGKKRGEARAGFTAVLESRFHGALPTVTR